MGGLLKPDAVYFGEGLPKDRIKRALELSKAARAFLIIGTSGSVAPACKLPKIAKAAGSRVIEVSPRETDLSDTADLLLLGTAAEVLPQLLEVVEQLAAEKARGECESGMPLKDPARRCPDSPPVRVWSTIAAAAKNSGAGGT